jgi:hypothetical protein
LVSCAASDAFVAGFEVIGLLLVNHVKDFGGTEKLLFEETNDVVEL